MEENIENENKITHAIKSGLIIGLISIVLSILVYVIDPLIFAKWWFGISLFILSLILVVVFGRKYRTSIGGFMGFGPAFIHGFVTFIAAGLIGTIFNILLHTVIDPDLRIVITEAALDNTAAMMESFGAPSDQIDEAMLKTEESMVEQFSLTGMLMSFVWSILVYAVLSLITGLIVKKNEPIEDM